MLGKVELLRCLLYLLCIAQRMLNDSEWAYFHISVCLYSTPRLCSTLAIICVQPYGGWDNFVVQQLFRIEIESCILRDAEPQGPHNMLGRGVRDGRSGACGLFP